MTHGPRRAPLRIWAAAPLILFGCAPHPAPRSAAPPPAAVAPTAAVPAPAAPPVSPPAATPIPLEREPTFDIGLTWDVDSLVISPEGPVVVRYPRAGGGLDSSTTANALALRVSGAQLLVQPVGAARAVPLATLGTQDTLWVGGPGSESGGAPHLRWGGHRWRGRFKAFLGPRGRITLATRVRLETYLAGVLPGEIGALKDSLVEAGRAQAVAARSFSLYYRGRRGSEGFDLYSTVEDQVYAPIESERPLASRCVESTRGEVALSGGQPIRANYHSTCGGILGETWEAWPTPAEPYLTSHRDADAAGRDYCAASPLYRWREEWTAAEFAQNLRRFAPTQGVPLPGAGVGSIRDVRVLSRSRSGRVWQLLVRTSTGDIVIPAHALRLVVRRAGRPEQILRSNLFKVAVRRDRPGGDVSAIVASGSGSGHGVGLCQTGALGMARAGVDADAILAHYYPGARLERLYTR